MELDLCTAVLIGRARDPATPSPAFRLMYEGAIVQPSPGVGPGPTLAWPGWKQPDIPVEVDTGRLENDVGMQEF
jgi:hypothetical protein